MNKHSLPINNEDESYLDEKELFILFCLLRNKHISTLWSGVFVPNNRHQIHISNSVEDRLKDFEEETSMNLKRMTSKSQSSVVFSYLLELGKELDEKGYSIFCNADYALLDGGFLYDTDNHHLMWQYLEHILEKGNKVVDKRFNTLTIQQKKAVENCILEENKKNGKVQFPSSKAYQPIKEYKETIINKKADEDFIVLVNKLITEYDGGKWDKDDVAQFLSIYYRHNKKDFQKNVMTEKAFLYEDYQTKLAKLIFESTDFYLSIKNTDKLKKYLSNYIDMFTGDKLNGSSRYGLSGSFFSEGLTTPLHKKLFGYKKQREILVKHIEDNYEKYKRNDLEIGNPFTAPEYIGNDKKGTVKIAISEINEEEDLFLFVHTMLALEYEKYLEIEGFSYGTTEIFDLYDRGFLFKVRLNDKKENVQGEKLFEEYDEKYHLLKFAGQEIELAKKGKETDAVLLLETLINTKNGEWKHNDQILEDWGYTEADIKRLPKNKIYFAGKKINNAIAIKTRVDDFIECNTSKARINPKYKRVDE